MGAFPIGENKTLEGEIFFEDLIEEVIILAGIIAIHFVVGAHNAGRLGDADSNLEREQVGFAKRAVIENYIENISAGLLIVDRVMLNVAHDLLRLNTFGEIADDGAREDWIFTRIFEGTAVAWFAENIDATANGHVETLIAQFSADD